MTTLPPSDRTRLIALANALVWKNPNVEVLRTELCGQYSALAETLQEKLHARQVSKKLVLPNLQAFNNKTIALYTDFGGEHKEALFRTYSTLVCGWNMSDLFLKRMKSIRIEHKLGEKEIAFKDFSMGQVNRALSDYLNALDFLPGFLFSIAIDKRIGSVFGPPGKDTQKWIVEALESEGFGGRKPHVSEKLLRVVHIVAFLAGLFTRDGQNVFWMTDNDAISETEEMHKQTLSLFQRILTLYTKEGTKFPVLGGALPFPDRELGTRDMLSATDVVAGSLSQYLTQKDTVASHEIRIKDGCDRVLQWLGHDGIGLKKMNVVMREGKDGRIGSATVEFQQLRKPSGVTIVPVFM